MITTPTMAEWGWDAIYKFGYNATVGGTDESIWTGSNVYPWPAAAAVTTIESTDGNDDGDPAGTGARTVEVQGVTSDYMFTKETVTLNGTSAVTLSNQYLRVFRALVKTAGSGGVNAGNIEIKHGATDIARIEAGENQTLMAVYTVPADYINAWMINWYASVGKLTDAQVRLVIREPGGVFAVKDLRDVYQESFVRTYDRPLRIAPKSDVEIRGQSATANADIAAGFDLLLES